MQYYFEYTFTLDIRQKKIISVEISDLGIAFHSIDEEDMLDGMLVTEELEVF